jgi:hypothetical protein
VLSAGVTKSMAQVHLIDDAKALKATKKAGSMAQSNPILVYSEGCEEGTCAVCLCEFKEEEEVRVLPECLHLFHATCVDSWVNSHSNCPLCRADLKRVRFRYIIFTRPQFCFHLISRTIYKPFILMVSAAGSGLVRNHGLRACVTGSRIVSQFVFLGQQLFLQQHLQRSLGKTLNGQMIGLARKLLN